MSLKQYCSHKIGVDEARRRYYESKKKNYSQTVEAVNRRKHLVDKELLMILNHDISDRELSKIIGRSVQSIQTKRSKLKAKQSNGIIRLKQGYAIRMYGSYQYLRKEN